MAAAATTTGGMPTSAWMGLKERKSKWRRGDREKVSCSVMDPYKTLRIRPGASEGEVKKAFRQLALRYHPDVCRGSNCGVAFQTINDAYDRVMQQLRSACVETEDIEGELWEEWMGWEGAGIRDYSSHINPYI